MVVLFGEIILSIFSVLALYTFVIISKDFEKRIATDLI